jgi:hypothetical protein
MTTRDQVTCSHCKRKPNGSWCCDKAELQALRDAMDQTINALSSEITAPLVIDDGGAARDVIRASRDLLRQARRSPAA